MNKIIRHIRNLITQINLRWMFYSRLRISFLFGIISICFSLLALVFGINSVTIEQFANPNSASKYDFTRLKNILEFPIDQFIDYKGAPKEIIFSKKKTIEYDRNFLIIDRTESVEIDKSQNENIFEHLKEYRSVESYNFGEVDDKDPRALLIDFCYNLVGSKNNTKLYYLKPEEYGQSFIESPFVRDTVNKENLYHTTRFITGVTNELLNQNESGDTKFYNLLNGICEQLKNGKKDKQQLIKNISITIISDFDNGERK